MDDVKHKINQIADDTNEIKITMAQMEVTLSLQQRSLDHHIKRTDLLEEKVSLLKESYDKSKGIKEFILFVAKVGTVLLAALAALKKFI
jgi:hypothetical protein